MKSLPALVCGLLFFLADTCLAAGEPAQSDAAAGSEIAKPLWNVRADVLMVAMPIEKMLPLLPDLRDCHKIDGAVTKLLAAVGRKEALLTGYPSLLVGDGSDGSDAQNTEIRYPADFEPPPYPTTVLPVETPADKAAAAAAAVAAAKERETSGLDRNLPSTFATRNATTTLNVTPHVGAQGDSVHLQFSAERWVLVGYDPYDAVLTRYGDIVKADEPSFYGSRVTSEVSLQSGQPALIGVFPLSKPAGYMEVFVLRATVIPLR